MIIEERNPDVLTHVAQRLRDQGYRLTPQRMAILKAVASNDSHPTAEEIYRRVAADFPMISLATVYKTLNVLEELGEVIVLQIDGRAHYERDVIPHPHLICVECGSIVDLPPETQAEMSEEALAGTGFHALRCSVKIYGLCPRCGEQGQAHK
jgi:Fur family peroxide stress response transcriptional regulator